MNRRTYQLEYVSGKRRPRSIVLPLTLLAIIPATIWALHELAVMPYRPPVDMNTLLGGAEENTISVLIVTLTVAWAGLLLWCVLRLRRTQSS